MNPPFHNSRQGFSLVELMIAAALFGLVMGGAIGVYVMCHKLWHAISLDMATSRYGNLALARMVYGVGTNRGLRTAAFVSIQYENMKGVWVGTDHVYPPAPGDPSHFLTPGLNNGSWRLTCSNVYDGTRWIDFNKVSSNIVLWLQDPSSEPHRETRQLICNYVSDAVVSNHDSGISIQLTILRQEGRYTSTNRVGTFIKMRN